MSNGQSGPFMLERVGLPEVEIVNGSLLVSHVDIKREQVNGR